MQFAMNQELSTLLDHAEEAFQIPCRNETGYPNFLATNSCGDNLLHAAVGQKMPESIRFLVKQGVDINARGDLHETPLLLACSLGHGEMVKLLLELGADPNMVDYQGQLPKIDILD